MVAACACIINQNGIRRSRENFPKGICLADTLHKYENSRDLLLYERE